MALEDIRTRPPQGSGDYRTLAEKALVDLREWIISGQLEPGEHLRVDKLADALGMSQLPIREALRKLADDGLVDLEPHKGSRVSQLSTEDLTEVAQTRVALEALASRRAAERFTEEDERNAREALERCVDAWERNASEEAWEEHRNFHFAIYEASRAHWLPRLVSLLWQVSERYRRSIGPVGMTLDDRRAEHQAILEACVDHDPDRAEAETRLHLMHVSDAISVGMGAEPIFGAETIGDSLSVAPRGARPADDD